MSRLQDTDRLHLDLRILFVYAEVMPSTCRVSFTDGANISHAVTVAAGSLCEAAALALSELKRSGFALAQVGPGTRLTAAAEAPAVTHELTVGKVQSWLNTNGRTPREQAQKVTLRQLLGACAVIVSAPE